MTLVPPPSGPGREMGLRHLLGPQHPHHGAGVREGGALCGAGPDQGVARQLCPGLPQQRWTAVVPAHEAQPWGPAGTSAQIPCTCPSLAGWPTSVQGCLEVPEKPLGALPSLPSPTSHP